MHAMHDNFQMYWDSAPSTYFEKQSPVPSISYTQSNACARARMALALGKLNFSCAVIGLTFINRACRQRTGTPKFRGSGCQFPQSQCHPSPRTGIALGTRLPFPRQSRVTISILLWCVIG